MLDGINQGELVTFFHLVTLVAVVAAAMVTE